MKCKTLKRIIRRVQPVGDVMKEINAIDRAFEQFGEQIGADVLVVERKVQVGQPIDDSLMDVLKAVRPDVLSIEHLEAHGKKVAVVLFKAGVVSVDYTGLSLGDIIRKILQEVLAA